MFSWGSKPKTSESSYSSPVLGLKLPDKNEVAAVELKTIADKYKKRTDQIDLHIRKAAKDRELAKKLSASYIHNYYVMIDISVLLNQYADFFQNIKEILAKSDVQLEQLNAQSFQDLEKLTRQEMDKFTTKFTDQAEKVKKLFMTYNMQEQAAKLSAVPQFTSQVSRAAEESKALNNPPSSYGGTKRRQYRKKKST